ncbi:unnamed protein product [Phytophthora fragariaefolia]|uniref:Unnamed protein product n=1 Tax=Phytophthora fragariaefolia TaxID=1490495 RepID=A0A9W6XIJ3_9STRA|nr:unnamed protein product [Phytophthora fragariaefolia]
MAPAAPDANSNKMTYRFLGNSGLLVSKLSLGSWMEINDKYTADAWYDMMKLAFEHGVNFFDNAEAYGAGLAEKNMGAAINWDIAEAASTSSRARRPRSSALNRTTWTSSSANARTRTRPSRRPSEL